MRSTIRSLEGSVGAAVQDQLVSAPEQAVKGALGDGEHDFVRVRPLERRAPVGG